jgi:hypothetical protein
MHAHSFCTSDYNDHGSELTVKLNLNGCLDPLGGYFSQFEVVAGHGVLFFGAINIFNSHSRYARCLRAPSESVNIQFPYEGEIELVYLDYTGAISQL